MISPSGRVENLCWPILLRNSQNIADFPLLMIFLFKGWVSPARRSCFMPGGRFCFLSCYPRGRRCRGVFPGNEGLFPFVTRGGHREGMFPRFRGGGHGVTRLPRFSSGAFLLTKSTS